MLKSDHTVKVLQFYNQENEKSRKIIELSNEILQESYFVLNGNMLITEEMRDKFSELYKIHDQRGVKFTESNEIFEISDHQNNQADYLFDADHLMAGDETTVNSNKRQRENGDDSNAIPMKKRVVRSIFDSQIADVTQVLDTHPTDDDNMNSTFAIKPAVSKVANKVHATTSRALKENNPNVHKAFVVPKAVTKTATKPITKVKSTLIQRDIENRRTPLKSIRRSPRSTYVDPLNRSEYKKEYLNDQVCLSCMKASLNC